VCLALQHPHSKLKCGGVAAKKKKEEK